MIHQPAGLIFRITLAFALVICLCSTSIGGVDGRRSGNKSRLNKMTSSSASTPPSDQNPDTDALPKGKVPRQRFQTKWTKWNFFNEIELFKEDLFQTKDLLHRASGTCGREANGQRRRPPCQRPIWPRKDHYSKGSWLKWSPRETPRLLPPCSKWQKTSLISRWWCRRLVRISHTRA